MAIHEKILVTLQNLYPDSPNVPDVATKLENAFYSTAKSLEEYADHSTLEKRIDEYDIVFLYGLVYKKETV